MNTEHTGSNESSVMFNLRQLMELETQRLSSEAEAARTAQLAAAQRRAEALRAIEEERLAEERAAAERVRQSELEAQRAEQERAAALLRVRLEAEANARIELERLAVERDRIALERARATQGEPVRRSALRVAVAVVSLVCALFGGGALHAALSGAQPSAATVREVDAGSASATPQPRPAPQEEPTPATTQAAASVPRVSRRIAPKQRGAIRTNSGSHRAQASNELDGLDLSSDDPFEM